VAHPCRKFTDHALGSVDCFAKDAGSSPFRRLQLGNAGSLSHGRAISSAEPATSSGEKKLSLQWSHLRVCPFPGIVMALLIFWRSAPCTDKSGHSGDTVRGLALSLESFQKRIEVA